MKRSERFKPIQQLAQQREDVAAQVLGKIQRELNAHHIKLSELIQYYEDYQTRYAEQASKGMSITQVQSYQKFISQLEIAITEQKKHISRVEEACSSKKDDWNTQRQKSQVLEKVMHSYEKKELQHENRQEQRRLDEFVSNRFWHLKK